MDHRFHRALRTTLGLALATSTLAFEVSASAAEPVAARNAAQIGRPVTVLHHDQLAATGQTSLSAAIAELVPAFRFAEPFASNGDDHVRVGTLRGLAPDQMTVLVNGKQQHTSALFYTSGQAGRGSVGFDLALIPMSAVARVEVLAGGASGRYGTGALAGVINVVLDDQDSGGSLSAMYGQRRTTISGVPKGTVVVLDEAADTVTIGRASQRVVDDGDGDDVVLQGSWGLPLGDGGFMRFAAEYQDRDATNRAGFDPRQQYPQRDDGSFDVRERTIDRLNNEYGDPDMTEVNISFNAALPLGEHVELYGFTSLGTRQSESAAEFRRPLDEDNVLAVYPDGFLPRMESDIDDRNYTIGFRGQRWGWDWDASYSQREDEIDWTLDDSLNPSLGEVSPTSFVTGNNENQLSYMLLEVGRSFAPAFLDHPVALELGLESRAEEYEMETGDTASYLSDGLVEPPVPAWSQGFAGYRDESERDRELTAFYATAHTRLGEGLAVAASGRVDSYKDGDEHFSFDLSAEMTLARAWHARAAGGVGYRVPSLAQVTYTRTRATATESGLVLDGTFAPDSAVAMALGGGELEEESARHGSVGLVFRPADALEVSVDAWLVDVDDRVVLSNLLQGSAAAAALNAAGIDNVSAARFALNGADTETRGIDLNARYSMDLGAGRLNLDAGLSQHRLQVSPTSAGGAAGVSPFGERAAEQLENAQPESKLILAAAWARGPVDLRGRVTRLGPVEDLGVADGQGVEMDAVWLADLDLRYAVNEEISLGVGVHNLLDEYPDVRPTGPEQPVSNAIFPFSGYSAFNASGRLMYARVSAMLR